MTGTFPTDEPDPQKFTDGVERDASGIPGGNVDYPGTIVTGDKIGDVLSKVLHLHESGITGSIEVILPGITP